MIPNRGFLNYDELAGYRRAASRPLSYMWTGNSFDSLIQQLSTLLKFVISYLLSDLVAGGGLSCVWRPELGSSFCFCRVH